MKNPIQVHSEKVGKNFIDILKEIVKHNLLTEDEKAQRLYELFCEVHSDWEKHLHIKDENFKAWNKC